MEGHPALGGEREKIQALEDRLSGVPGGSK
jgi:hypothetical protein